MSTIQRIPEIICSGLQVPELGQFCFFVNYRGTERSAILVRFRGRVYGYLNLNSSLSHRQNEAN
jgi:hypothetical protein